MKKLAFSVLAALLLFSACNKAEDKKDVSSFSFSSNETAETPYGFIDDYGDEGMNITFADIPSNSKYTGKVSLMQLHLYTLAPGTYTYLSGDSARFNTSKNFPSAICYHKAAITNGVVDTNSGTNPGDPTAGTVTLKKDGEIYTITYDISYGITQVRGRYIGKPVYSK
jgi:hypothetical protein